MRPLSNTLTLQAAERAIYTFFLALFPLASLPFSMLGRALLLQGRPPRLNKTSHLLLSLKVCKDGFKEKKSLKPVFPHLKLEEYLGT